MIFTLLHGSEGISVQRTTYFFLIEVWCTRSVLYCQTPEHGCCCNTNSQAVVDLNLSAKDKRAGLVTE